MTITSDAIGNLIDEATRGIDVLDDGDAAVTADAIIDSVIDTLNDHTALPKLPRSQWELLLANARNHIASDLADLIEGKADFHKMVDAISGALDDSDSVFIRNPRGNE
jgi:hypothetical protein